MPAQYRMVAKLGENSPIVILGIQTEYELVLDRTKLEELSSLVNVVGDGQLNADERFDWNIALDAISKLHGRISEVPDYVLGLETTWRSLPTKALQQILIKYHQETGPSFTVSIDGRPPSLSLVLNIGTASAKFPMDEGTANRFAQESGLLRVECEKADQEGRDWKGAGDAVIDNGKVTYWVTKCAWELAKAAGDRGKSAGKALEACGKAADAVEKMIRSVREKQEAERQRLEKEVLDRIGDCKPDKAIDADALDRFSRTA